MKNKTIKTAAGDKAVSVDTVEVQREEGKLPAVKVTAVCDGETVSLVHTFAPVDGAHADLDVEHVQRGIAATEGRAVKLAVLRAQLRAQLDTEIASAAVGKAIT